LNEVLSAPDDGQRLSVLQSSVSVRPRAAPKMTRLSPQR